MQPNSSPIKQIKKGSSPQLTLGSLSISSDSASFKRIRPILHTCQEDPLGIHSKKLRVKLPQFRVYNVSNPVNLTLTGTQCFTFRKCLKYIRSFQDFSEKYFMIQESNFFIKKMMSFRYSQCLTSIRMIVIPPVTNDFFKRLVKPVLPHKRIKRFSVGFYTFQSKGYAPITLSLFNVFNHYKKLSEFTICNTSDVQSNKISLGVGDAILSEDELQRRLIASSARLYNMQKITLMITLEDTHFIKSLSSCIQKLALVKHVRIDFNYQPEFSVDFSACANQVMIFQALGQLTQLQSVQLNYQQRSFYYPRSRGTFVAYHGIQDLLAKALKIRKLAITMCGRYDLRMDDAIRDIFLPLPAQITKALEMTPFYKVENETNDDPYSEDCSSIKKNILINSNHLPSIYVDKPHFEELTLNYNWSQTLEESSITSLYLQSVSQFPLKKLSLTTAYESSLSSAELAENLVSMKQLEDIELKIRFHDGAPKLFTILQNKTNFKRFNLDLAGKTHSSFVKMADFSSFITNQTNLQDFSLKLSSIAIHILIEMIDVVTFLEGIQKFEFKFQVGVFPDLLAQKIKSMINLFGYTESFKLAYEACKIDNSAKDTFLKCCYENNKIQDYEIVDSINKYRKNGFSIL